MKSKLSVILIGLFLALHLTGTAYSERRVIVNGERLNNGQIQTLEQWHCGPIANGNYWLNTNTGTWGYAGNPRPMGNIADNCYNPERRPGLSERGLLFGPGDWLKQK